MVTSIFFTIVWGNNIRTHIILLLVIVRHNDDIHRDVPVTRLFVYDSFNIDTPEMIFDIQQTQKQTILFDTNSIIAFPPTTIEHEAAMMLHYNLVLSDLMVTIFRHLEQKVVHATRCIIRY